MELFCLKAAYFSSLSIYFARNIRSLRRTSYFSLSHFRKFYCIIVCLEVQAVLGIFTGWRACKRGRSYGTDFIYQSYFFSAYYIFSEEGSVLLVILAILIIACIVLYFLGKKAEKRQAEQKEKLDAAAQTMSMLIIDKGRLRWGLRCI